MKNFLFKTKTRIAMFIGVVALAALAATDATPFGDINMQYVSGRLPRLGIGVNIATDQVTYQVNGLGRFLFRSTGNDTDSSTFEIDSTDVTISNNLSTGAVNGKLVIDSSVVITAITGATVSAPYLLVSSGAAAGVKISGAGNKGVPATDTLSIVNAPNLTGTNHAAQWLKVTINDTVGYIPYLRTP